MEKLNKWLPLITLLVVIAMAIGLVGGNQSGLLGASGSRFPNGISADSTSPVAGEVRGTDLTITDDATISGGALTVTTAPGATSTLIVGEIETYATSSATKICLKFNTIATSSEAGYVLWNYGTCP